MSSRREFLAGSLALAGTAGLPRQVSAAPKSMTVVRESSFIKPFDDYFAKTLAAEFTLAQNELLYALIFLGKSEVRTVPVGAITELIRGDVFYWGQLMAAALLGSVPVAIIYSFFVEHYVAGLTAGSVKN